MLSNIIQFNKNNKYTKYYYVKCKLNLKYKKIIKCNKYNKIKNPRKEVFIKFKTSVNKNKFYINE